MPTPDRIKPDEITEAQIKARGLLLLRLGNSPVDLGMARAFLLQHGWTWPNAITDASVALDSLIAAGRAEKAPGCYRLTTRQMPDKPQDGEKDDE